MKMNTTKLIQNEKKMNSKGEKSAILTHLCKQPSDICRLSLVYEIYMRRIIQVFVSRHRVPDELMKANQHRDAHPEQIPDHSSIRLKYV